MSYLPLRYALVGVTKVIDEHELRTLVAPPPPSLRAHVAGNPDLCRPPRLSLNCLYPKESGTFRSLATIKRNSGDRKSASSTIVFGAGSARNAQLIVTEDSTGLVTDTGNHEHHQVLWRVST